MSAFFSDARIQEIVDRHGLPQQMPESIATVDELKDKLFDIPDKGYAITEHEAVENVAAVVVPIIAEDHVRGAIAIASPVAYGRTNHIARSSSTCDESI